MPFWADIYFMNANSPVMEQMVLFHDHSMMIIMSTIVFLLLMMYNTTMNKIMFLNLMDNQNIEIIWTMSPMILLIFIALPSLKILYLMEETYTPNLNMKIIGHQWYWSYEYSEFKLNFDSFMNNEKTKNFRLIETDMPVYLPMNSLSRLLVTSADVIHSWTIQSLGVKTDAIPGRLNQINLHPTRPGFFFGQCSEICGSNHSFMPISLKITHMKKFSNLIKSLI
uniref:Cytochrome c oxidase subunit 2 n=1 Tax=Neoseiulus womersleyi TaxID=322050 RepID=A0A8F6U3V7_9ACAR|nr:cytochrome c oxidase subunit 2 [Neoseiulus womersleyi]